MIKETFWRALAASLLIGTVAFPASPIPYEKADLDTLKSRFNASKGKPRLILLVSPT